MPNYRRNFQPGGTFFFTVVTFNRQPIFTDDTAVSLLRQAMRDVKQRRPFNTDAIVILPDHLHVIWTLPEGDGAFDKRWSTIKSRFTRDWLDTNGLESAVSVDKTMKRQRGIWQPRYIEHTIRDEDDLNQHIDYIHFNPVKHGLVQRPIDWPWSSLHRYVERGVLSPDWGCGVCSPADDRLNPALLE